MTLQSTGTISLSNVNTELTSSGQLNLGASSVRSLASLVSGEISLSDLYGRTFIPPLGLNWTLRSVPSPLAATNGGTGSVCGNSTGFVAAFYDSSPAGNHAIFSSDGVSWINISAAVTTAIGAAKVGITTYAVDGLFIIGTDGASIYSTDGTTWNALTSLRTVFPANISLLRLSHNGSMWIAVGESGRCGTSPDGITWTQRTGLATAVSSNVINDVCWTGSQWVAVGNSGKCATSPDGITWTNNTAFTTKVVSTTQAKTVVSNGSIIIATTSLATQRCVASTDGGVSWSTLSTSLYANFIRSHYAQGTFLGVTLSKYFYTSPDGITWTEQTPHRTLMNTDTIYECDFCYAQNKIVAFSYSASLVRCLTSP